MIEPFRILKNLLEVLRKGGVHHAPKCDIGLIDDVYQKFSQRAREENRSMANLVETLALQKLTEEIFTDTFETEEVLANSALMKKLKRGHVQAKLRKGRFVE